MPQPIADPLPTPVTSTTPLTRLFVIIAALTLLFILGMVLAQQLRQTNVQDNPKQTTPIHSEAIPKPIEKTEIDAVLYFNEKGIYQLPLNTEEDTATPTLLAREEIIQNAKRYGDTVLFNICTSSEQGTRCQLKQYDVPTDDTTVLRTLPFNHYISAFDYYPQSDLFAYTIIDDEQNVSVLVIELASNTVLLEEQIGTRIGRGIGFNDSFTTVFSQDGMHVLMTDTALEVEESTPSATIFVYNIAEAKQVAALGAAEEIALGTATHPIWYSDDTILYKDLTTTPASLALYNITTQETQALPFEGDMHNIKLIDQTLTYWLLNPDAQSTTLQFTNVETEEIIATSPNVTNFEILDPTHIVGTSIRACNTAVDECGPSPFITTGLVYVSATGKALELTNQVGTVIPSVR